MKYRIKPNLTQHPSLVASLIFLACACGAAVEDGDELFGDSEPMDLDDSEGIAEDTADVEIGSRSIALTGGSDVSSAERQTGILRYSSFDGADEQGSCTATVLSSSARDNRTWLVTAAHCFSHRDDAFYVYSHFGEPRASIRHTVVGERCDGRPSPGVRECLSDASDSTVYVHDEWLKNGGHTAWFGPRDMAIIRVNEAIPVYDADDQRIEEFRRPIFAGSPTRVAEPFREPDISWHNVFCGQGSGKLRCDRLTNLWYSPNFRHQFVQLPRGAWTGGFYEAGDSGGPLLAYGQSFSGWDGLGNDAHAAKHGVVLGVLQGPTVFCDYIQNGNCDPADGLATHFSGADEFLSSIPDNDEIIRTDQLHPPRVSTLRFRAIMGNDLPWPVGPMQWPHARVFVPEIILNHPAPLPLAAQVEVRSDNDRVIGRMSATWLPGQARATVAYRPNEGADATPPGTPALTDSFWLGCTKAGKVRGNAGFSNQYETRVRLRVESSLFSSVNDAGQNVRCVR